MKYPTLNVQASSRQVIDAFGGYNHRLRIGEGEFYDMKNLSSANYPILSPRGQRGVYASPALPLGMVAKDTLCYVDGSKFVMDQYSVDMGLNSEEKTLVSMGAYVIILPDKKYINTADITDFGNIEATVTTAGDVSFTLCRLDGDDYTAAYTQSSEPSNPENMALWIDTSTTPHTLKQWSDTSGMWVSIATTYIRISATGIGVPFEKYDGITISGLKDVTLTDTSGDEIYDGGQLAALDGSAIVWDKGDDFIVVVGILDVTRTITNAITIKRSMPNMDYVVEANNRLWGCRYGVADNGEVVNEIYASKLGDFKNWNCFMGISTDSYAASLGTDGQFTGAITHLGYPLFFKEGFLHKVYGNYPSNFQVQTTACRGVQRGCSRSLAIVNEILYYKARGAVCAYDGSLPTEISAALGDVQYFEAVGGSHGNKYYLSMKDSSNLWHLFVYDTAKGMWHHEDNTHADCFCSCREEMYFIDHADKKIRTVFGGGTKDTKPVEWMAETGVIGVDSPDKKYLSRLTVRMWLDIGTQVYFFVQYDSGGEWEHLFTMTGNNLRSFAVPIRPKRCDHLRIRIVGEGDAKIYSIAKVIEEGSDY